LDLGRVLKDTAMYGPVSLTAEANGQGLDLKTMNAKIKAEATTITLNKYTYHDLKMDGSVAGRVFEGKINLKDKNAEFDLDASANLNPGQEQFQFRLNLAGADLQKLHFSQTDLRIGLVATADFKGKSVGDLNGKAKIANLVLAHDAQKYELDSVVFTSVNGTNKSEFNVSSALIDVKYSGSVSPFNLPSEIGQFISQYFQVSDSVSTNKKNRLQDFNFEIQLHNHPILSEIVFPELHEFQPGIIQGSFDSLKNNVKLDATIPKMIYGSTEINDFTMEVNSDLKALNYRISCRNISNSLASLDHFLIDGNLADNKINTTVSSVDEKKNKKLQISSQIIWDKANYKLTLDPADFYLMHEKWNIAADNSIEFGKQGFLIHHFFLNDDESQINVASVNDQFNDDLNIELKNLALGDISGIFEKDSSLVKGVVDGNILLKRVNNSYGLIADAKIMNLIVSNIPIGNLTVKAENPTTEKFNIDLKLSGAENNLTATGFYVPNGGDQSIHITAAIQSLSLQTVQAFSMGTITKASGNLTGNFRVEGNTTLPEITGEISFNNAFITPAFLNNPLELKHETFQLKKDGMYFNSFTILDKQQHTAILDGVVNMNQFSDFKFALNVNTKDFLLFNTTHEDNKEFYGRMVIDSKIEVSGPMSLPVVNATLKLKKGSNFTFAVPEDRLTTDKGEDVVEFESGTNLNPILYRTEKKEVQKSSLTGFDVSSILEIDKEATLRLLMDPSSTDSLVVRGDAALSFTIDRSGKMSLTGAYNLHDGSYMTSLESIIKRKFDIDRGSIIVWNGDPYDAEISINARYPVRASPIDLMSDQMSGLSETDRSGYKQRYPFLVLLKLRGKILHPEISFEIQLPPDEKGILSGAVNQKLSMLNEDESALNKQVFALLVLGRFIQENPLQTESGGTSTFVRATVGKFLSQQLNQLSSKVLPGVDLNFEIQSYNAYQTGQAQGRTQVDIGLKKQLFGERLSIELGGTVDVEGETARQNPASNITSDVNVEYKLTKDGRYRLKGFRHNQYEGVIEGQLVETGAGIIYVRDFNKWNEFLKSNKKTRVTR
jgi:autotransporter translocation and assembly factor TamB